MSLTYQVCANTGVEYEFWACLEERKGEQLCCCIKGRSYNSMREVYNPVSQVWSQCIRPCHSPQEFNKGVASWKAVLKVVACISPCCQRTPMSFPLPNTQMRRWAERAWSLVREGADNALSLVRELDIALSFEQA